MMLGGIHGSDEAKVYKELCQAVEEWIAVQGEDGEPLPPATAGREYSGRFVLRVGRELHKGLALDALQRGKSLNSSCADVLRRRGRQQGKTASARSSPARFARRSPR